MLAQQRIERVNHKKIPLLYCICSILPSSLPEADLDPVPSLFASLAQRRRPGGAFAPPKKYGEFVSKMPPRREKNRSTTHLYSRFESLDLIGRVPVVNTYISEERCNRTHFDASGLVQTVSLHVHNFTRLPIDSPRMFAISMFCLDHEKIS